MLRAIWVPLWLLAAVTHLPRLGEAGILSAMYEADFSHDPDADLNVTQIIARWGYPVENYEVITEDGYILRECLKELS